MSWSKIKAQVEAETIKAKYPLIAAGLPKGTTAETVFLKEGSKLGPLEHPADFPMGDAKYVSGATLKEVDYVPAFIEAMHKVLGDGNGPVPKIVEHMAELVALKALQSTAQHDLSIGKITTFLKQNPGAVTGDLFAICINALASKKQEGFPEPSMMLATSFLMGLKELGFTPKAIETSQPMDESGQPGLLAFHLKSGDKAKAVFEAIKGLIDTADQVAKMTEGHL